MQDPLQGLDLDNLDEIEAEIRSLKALRSRSIANCG